MKVVIVGAGFTGVQLAKALVAEGKEVALVERDAEKVRHARNTLDCTVVEADGNNLKVLEDDAGIASASALVVLTEDDEINMVTCSLADAVYPELLSIARVRNDAYYAGAKAARQASAATVSSHGALRPFGIDTMLHPDVEAAEAICRALLHGAVGNVIDLGCDFGIASVPVDDSSPLAGLRMRDLSSVEGWRWLIAYVETSGEATLPSGDTILTSGCRIGVVASADDMPDLLKFVPAASKAPPKRVAVFGAGRVGVLVVERQLEAATRASFFASLFGAAAAQTEIVLVDADERRCREATERFKGVRVLCGDMNDADFLRDEGLDGFDLLVAASESYERHLVAAAYLKSRGVGKVVALTESADFDDVARKLGIDVAVSMRDTVVDAVMSHLRGPGVKSVHTVCNGRFEVVSCEASEDGKVVGKPLRDVALRGECLVLLMRRAGTSVVEVPRGDAVIKAGDSIVFMTRAGNVRFAKLFCGKGSW